MQAILEKGPTGPAAPSSRLSPGMVPLLFLLFIILPIAEIYVIIQVGQAIGVLWTILLLIADSIIGARLLSWQGRRAWLRFQEALAAGRLPHREVMDGALIIVGGAFLLAPGFITDAFGLVLLIPPSRAVVRRVLSGFLMRRSAVRVARVATWPMRRPSRPEPPRPTAYPSPPDPPRTPELPPG
jgi:UPF0716 protein FxsA